MPEARRALRYLLNGIVVVVIAVGIFLTLVSIGIISRPASETFSFAG